MVGFIIINLFIILILDDSVMDSDEVDGNVDDNIDDSDVTYNNSDKNSDNNDGTTLPAFSESTGVRVDTTGFTPIDYFKLLWSDQLTEDILYQSNLYGNEYLQNKDYLQIHPRARAHIFRKKNITLHEMNNFIAIIISMGVINFPNLPSYWKTSWHFSNTCFIRIMSRDRFLVIAKFLHLADNDYLTVCQTMTVYTKSGH